MLKKRTKSLLNILLLLFITGFILVLVYKSGILKSRYIEPNIKWETNFDYLQLSEDELKTIDNFLKDNGTREFLVVKNNKIIFEWYSEDYNVNRPHFTASLAKAIVGSMVLQLVLQDSLLSLEDYAYKYIPHWENDSLKSLIKIKHLASHTSGLEDAREEKDENQYELEGWKGQYWQEPGSRFPISLNEVPVLFKPGSALAYSNTGISCLSYILSKVLKDSGKPDLKTYFNEKIIDPVGIPGSDWSMSYKESYQYDGLTLYEIGGGGLFTARAAAKIGQLMLGYGKADGKYIIDSSLVAKAVSFNNESLPDNPHQLALPGLGWWTNYNKTWHKLPEDTFSGWGSQHQIVLIIPGINLVLIRFGKFFEDQYPENELKDLDEYVFNPIIDFFITETN
jgi:CubicO group peptidase (beta-lactamase class C family)